MTPPCCFAVIANSPAGWGHPALRGKKNLRAVGTAIMPPATAVRILRSVEQNRTGRNYVSPPNLPGVCNIPIRFIKKSFSPLDKLFLLCYSIFVSYD